MKIDIVDTKGKKVADMTLDASVFGVDVNTELLAQYVHVYNTNLRQGTRKSKTRGEVSGGGKKPWRQKGTGRARVGSTRGPIWRHGGVAHGPKPYDYKLTLPKKMKKLAMQSALSAKFKNGAITVLDTLTFDKPSTKIMHETLKVLGLVDKTLVVIDTNDKNIVKSVSNLQNTVVELVGGLNPFQVLNTKKVLFVKESVVKLQEKYK